jgi:hypothetical protein
VYYWFCHCVSCSNQPPIVSTNKLGSSPKKAKGQKSVTAAFGGKLAIIFARVLLFLPLFGIFLAVELEELGPF